MDFYEFNHENIYFMDPKYLFLNLHSKFKNRNTFNSGGLLNVPDFFLDKFFFSCYKPFFEKSIFFDKENENFNYYDVGKTVKKIPKNLLRLEKFKTKQKTLLESFENLRDLISNLQTLQENFFFSKASNFETIQQLNDFIVLAKKLLYIFTQLHLYYSDNIMGFLTHKYKLDSLFDVIRDEVLYKIVKTKLAELCETHEAIGMPNFRNGYGILKGKGFFKARKKNHKLLKFFIN